MLQSYYREGKTCKCQQQDIPYILIFENTTILPKYLWTISVRLETEQKEWEDKDGTIRVFPKCFH